MSLRNRISRLITANVHHLLDEAEDPEVMARQLVRDMELSLADLRRETVRAVTRQKQLEKQVAAAVELTKDLEENARLALAQNDEAQARQLLTKKLHIQNTFGDLQQELERATKFAAQLRTDLARLENQAQEARRKQEALIRRQRAAESQLRFQEAARRSAVLSEAASSTEDDIAVLEARAEAAQELVDMEIKLELELQKLAEKHSVEEELHRLKEELI